MVNIKDYIFQNEKCDVTHTKIAIIQDDKYISYGELEVLIDKFSLKLVSDGVSKGDFIAIWMTDSIDLISSFWGAIQIGVIPVLINTKNSLTIFEYIYKDSNCSALYLNKGTKSKKDDINFSKDIHYWDDLKQNQIQWKPVRTTEKKDNDDTFVLYTSGTTGMPKGVIHSPKSIKAICENYQRTNCNFKKEDTIFSMSKIPFALGVGTSCILSLFCKSTLVISEFEIISNILKLVNRTIPTVLVGVPSIYTSLLDLFSLEELSFTSLRLCICCGEPLPPIASRKWEKKYHVPLFEGMGTSEFLYIFFLNTLSAKDQQKAGSVGTPLPGYKTSVLDEDGYPIVNKTGDLYIEGSSIMNGYLGQTPLKNSGMYTGDRFKIDSDGFYWYMGRKNDLFKVNGEWCKAADIEFLILNYSEVVEAVVDLETNEHENLLIYYLVTKDPSSFDVVKFKNYIRRKLSGRLMPKKIILIDSIPKGITGKVDRLKVKKIKPIKIYKKN